MAINRFKKNAPDLGTKMPVYIGNAYVPNMELLQQGIESAQGVIDESRLPYSYEHITDSDNFVDEQKYQEHMAEISSLRDEAREAIAGGDFQNGMRLSRQIIEKIKREKEPGGLEYAMKQRYAEWVEAKKKINEWDGASDEQKAYMMGQIGGGDAVVDEYGNYVPLSVPSLFEVKNARELVAKHVKGIPKVSDTQLTGGINSAFYGYVDTKFRPMVFTANEVREFIENDPDLERQMRTNAAIKIRGYLQDEDKLRLAFDGITEQYADNMLELSEKIDDYNSKEITSAYMAERASMPDNMGALSQDDADFIDKAKEELKLYYEMKADEYRSIPFNPRAARELLIDHKYRSDVEQMAYEIARNYEGRERVKRRSVNSVWARRMAKEEEESDSPGVVLSDTDNITANQVFDKYFILRNESYEGAIAFQEDLENLINGSKIEGEQRKDRLKNIFIGMSAGDKLRLAAKVYFSKSKEEAMKNIAEFQMLDAEGSPSLNFLDAEKEFIYDTFNKNSSASRRLVGGLYRIVQRDKAATHLWGSLEDASNWDPKYSKVTENQAIWAARDSGPVQNWWSYVFESLFGYDRNSDNTKAAKDAFVAATKGKTQDQVLSELATGTLFTDDQAKIIMKNAHAPAGWAEQMLVGMNKGMLSIVELITGGRGGEIPDAVKSLGRRHSDVLHEILTHALKKSVKNRLVDAKSTYNTYNFDMEFDEGSKAYAEGLRNTLGYSLIPHSSTPNPINSEGNPVGGKTKSDLDWRNAKFTMSISGYSEPTIWVTSTVEKDGKDVSVMQRFRTPGGTHDPGMAQAARANKDLFAKTHEKVNGKFIRKRDQEYLARINELSIFRNSVLDEDDRMYAMVAEFDDLESEDYLKRMPMYYPSGEGEGTFEMNNPIFMKSILNKPLKIGDDIKVSVYKWHNQVDGETNKPLPKQKAQYSLAFSIKDANGNWSDFSLQSDSPKSDSAGIVYYTNVGDAMSELALMYYEKYPQVVEIE